MSTGGRPNGSMAVGVGMYVCFCSGQLRKKTTSVSSPAMEEVGGEVKL